MNHQINTAVFLAYNASGAPKSKPFTYIVSMSVIAGIIITLTVIGNLVAILAVIKEIKRGQTHNMFILSHAISDFYVGAVVEPIYLYSILNVEWNLGQAVCLFYLITDWVVIFASAFTIFFTMLDRYLRVASPIKYGSWITNRKVNYMILFTWVFPAVLFGTTFTLIIPEGYVHNDKVCQIPLMTDPLFSNILLIVQFWIPTMLKILFFWRIYVGYKRAFKLSKQLRPSEHNAAKPDFTNNHSASSSEDFTNYRNEKNGEFWNSDVDSKLRKSTTSKQKQTGQSSGVKNDPQTSVGHTTPTTSYSLQDKQVLTTLALIVGAFVVLHSPFAVLISLPPICGPSCFNPVLFELFFGLVYIASAVNPFLYAKANKNLRVSMINILRCNCSG